MVRVEIAASIASSGSPPTRPRTVRVKPEPRTAPICATIRASPSESSRAVISPRSESGVRIPPAASEARNAPRRRVRAPEPISALVNSST